MSGFVDRENEIFETIQAFIDEGLEFVVVGGYAVSAYQHRFSVDADLVVPDTAVGQFVAILEDRGFEEVADRELDVYGGRYLAYEKDRELPVTIDLLVNSLHCRQTGASWPYRYFEHHSTLARIDGSEKSIEVRIPERELLLAVKLHSGRQTDARDAVALATEFDRDELERHLDRGDEDRLRHQLENVLDTLTDEGFEDSFKGVFQQQTLPEQQIEALREAIREAK